MKLFLSLLLFFVVSYSWAQQDSVRHVYHPVMGTLSLGFLDPYKLNYSLPAGYVKNNTSGYANIGVKVEYGVSRHVGIAATAGYDAFVYNFNRVYSGNKGSFTRSNTDKFRAFNAGLAAFYHLGDVLNIKHLDPFVGLGLSANNIRYGAYPRGDTAAVITEHPVTLYAKVGARYAISKGCSLYGDVGYERQSVVSLGFSCRLSKRPPPLEPSVLTHHAAFVPPAPVVPAAPDTPRQVVAEPIVKPAEPVVERPVPVVETLTKMPEPVLERSTLQFKLGQSSVGANSQLLNTTADVLKACAQCYLQIDGYADTTGTARVNRRVSQQRADMVKQYLVAKGIDPQRLIAKGHGSRDAIATNRTRAGRMANRRVKLTLINKADMHK